MYKRYQVGSLVRARNREWVVLPSPYPDFVILRPLSGCKEETAGIYLPLAFSEDRIENTSFPNPSMEDIGNLSAGRLLYNAARLSFRSGGGPFRCLGQLSFRPRAYQLVPLIMALRQDVVRLFIADDVGIGKTIESLLVVKELLERGKIKRFAIVCLPHLCEQWQKELHEKFGIDAVVIRSNTQSRLEREMPGDKSIFQHYRYQIVSIDYIKTDARRNLFVLECPELIIVDEAHTCARPKGTQKSQQLRHSLVYDIAQKENQHLLLLSATPHSGKPEEFQSLLGLMDKKYETLYLPDATSDQRKEAASFFIQRRRADVESYMQEENIFPARESKEMEYSLSPEYQNVFDQILEWAQKILQKTSDDQKTQRVHYWTVLGLMRGVLSSPAAGIEMLSKKLKKQSGEEIETMDNGCVLDEDYGQEKDFSPFATLSSEEWKDFSSRKGKSLLDQMEKTKNLSKDRKIAEACNILKEWGKEGFQSVVFCRYIATAHYVGEILKTILSPQFPGMEIQIVTSEDPDEVRQERVESMKLSAQRILVATDCLSEGINLQESFNAVLHYDLPWNPNRLEQREGRVDRFGQKASKIKTHLLYAKDNPIEGIVLRVIIQKIREIRKQTGISLPFPEDSKSIMDTVFQSILLQKTKEKKTAQQVFDFGEIEPHEIRITQEIEQAAQREKKTRTIFAQHSIKAQEIEQDLQEMDLALGNPQAVEDFVCSALSELFGTQISSQKQGKYRLYPVNIPPALKSFLPEQKRFWDKKQENIRISFLSPAPEDYMYLGRNHPFVEALCHYILSGSLNHDSPKIARASVVRTQSVAIKTTLFLLRVRNVIESKKASQQLIAEEMIFWGYQGTPEEKKELTQEQAIELLESASASSDMSPQSRRDFLQNELENLDILKPILTQIAEQRSKHLVEAHERFSKTVAHCRYQVVYPVLPMDILGIYILLPEIKKT